MRIGGLVSILLTVLVFSACNNDDDVDITIVPPRLLSEVAVEDEAAIQEFLQTHFYNYEEFDSPPAGFDFKIVIDTIAGANSDKTPLSEQVSDTTITVTSDEFNLDEEETVSHKMYYLLENNGAGSKPTFADSVFVRYRGQLLDGTVFDGSDNQPVWFDLASIQGPLQGARGFSHGLTPFAAAANIIPNPDGTVSAEDYGLGLIIMPSGLGFFNAGQASIPIYSPLIFTIDLFTINPTDHDGDGIPSAEEDLNNNGFLYDDNTDEAAEQAINSFIFVNFLDVDDDQDGTSTRDEITDDEGNIIFPYPDADGDGTPDYLDEDTP